MDALFYAEISNEIRTRQEADLYLSSLYDSEDKEEVKEVMDLDWIN
jgi:hypothetical protein